MEELNYFTRLGNVYTMKRQYVHGFTVVAGFCMFALVGPFIDLPEMTWIFGVIAILSLISIYRKKVVIDLAGGEIVAKSGLINSPVHIPLQNFQNFQLVRTTQYFITLNTSLHIIYHQNGEQKYAIIAQGFTTGSMQKIMNEMVEILEANESK